MFGMIKFHDYQYQNKTKQDSKKDKVTVKGMDGVWIEIWKRGKSIIVEGMSMALMRMNIDGKARKKQKGTNQKNDVFHWEFSKFTGKIWYQLI